MWSGLPPHRTSICVSAVGRCGWESGIHRNGIEAWREWYAGMSRDQSVCEWCKGERLGFDCCYLFALLCISFAIEFIDFLYYSCFCFWPLEFPYVLLSSSAPRARKSLRKRTDRPAKQLQSYQLQLMTLIEITICLERVAVSLRFFGVYSLSEKYRNKNGIISKDMYLMTFSANSNRWVLPRNLPLSEYEINEDIESTLFWSRCTDGFVIW